MTTPAIPHPASSEGATWDNLKQAISGTSGFKRWWMEKQINGHLQGLSLDCDLDSMVTRYLRETLETLAY